MSPMLLTRHSRLSIASRIIQHARYRPFRAQNTSSLCHLNTSCQCGSCCSTVWSSPNPQSHFPVSAARQRVPIKASPWSPQHTALRYQCRFLSDKDSSKDNNPEIHDIEQDNETPLISPEDMQLAVDAAISDIPGTTQGGGKQLAIVFTCKVCGTRSAKQFTERAYKHGVVMVRCPGCENLHLIADRLGFFEDKGDGGWDIEKALSEMGENVKAVTDDNVLELTLEDLLGDELTDKWNEQSGRGDTSSTSSTTDGENDTKQQ